MRKSYVLSFFQFLYKAARAGYVPSLAHLPEIILSRIRQHLLRALNYYTILG